MKKLLCVIFLALLSCGISFAQVQDLTGTWQGTLTPKAGGTLRTVIKISKAADGTLKAVLYSIDQGGQGIAAGTVTQQGSTVKYEVAPIGGAYEGKLSADGNSIEGTWTQGNAPLPLTLTRASADTAWTIPGPPKPMAADADPAFEVATIKPSNPDLPGKGFRVRSRQFTTINTTLVDLISFA